MPITEATLTDRDIETLTKLYEEEVEPSVLDGSYDGPTVAMTSLGYVDVFSDGDVAYHNVIIANVTA